MMKECDVLELDREMKESGGGCVLVDVREYAEYAGGRVPGTKLIPLGEVERRSTEIDREKRVFLICRSGRRSAEAQAKLARLGFSDVRNVRGGFEVWKSSGLPVESDPDPVWSLERQVRFAAGSLVVLGTVLSFLAHPYLAALSGFVGAGLVFAAVTDTCGMAMVLSRMPWNRQPAATCESNI